MSVGPHKRQVWRHDDPRRVLVHKRLSVVKGTYGKSERDSLKYEDRYERAKRQYSTRSACRFGNGCQQAGIDRISTARVS